MRPAQIRANPAAHEIAKVGQRVANRHSLPIEHCNCFAASVDSKQHVVEPEIAVDQAFYPRIAADPQIVQLVQPGAHRHIFRLQQIRITLRKRGLRIGVQRFDHCDGLGFHLQPIGPDHRLIVPAWRVQRGSLAHRGAGIVQRAAMQLIAAPLGQQVFEDQDEISALFVAFGHVRDRDANIEHVVQLAVEAHFLAVQPEGRGGRPAGLVGGGKLAHNTGRTSALAVVSQV